MDSELKIVTQKEFIEMYIRETRLHLDDMEISDNCDDVGTQSFDFSHLDLSNLVFQNLNIPNANFEGSDLSNTYFLCCTMNNSNFRYVNLSKAVFHSCNLSGSDFYDANMSYADVSLTFFHDCDFTKADMSGIFNARRAYWEDSYIEGAINPPQIDMACPAVGSFIGYKKCFGDRLVTLLIPEEAKRSSATGKKCRCDRAKVISIEGAYKDDVHYKSATSYYDGTFTYKVGETVTSEFCDDRYFECAPGIHFFLNKEDAIHY